MLWSILNIFISFQGYDNCTRLINHNITQTLYLEDIDYDGDY